MFNEHVAKYCVDIVIFFSLMVLSRDSILMVLGIGLRPAFTVISGSNKEVEEKEIYFSLTV